MRYVFSRTRAIEIDEMVTVEADSFEQACELAVNNRPVIGGAECLTKLEAGAAIPEGYDDDPMDLLREAPQPIPDKYTIGVRSYNEIP
jgi:hypothetical protein